MPTVYKLTITYTSGYSDVGCCDVADLFGAVSNTRSPAGYVSHKVEGI